MLTEKDKQEIAKIVKTTTIDILVRALTPIAQGIGDIRREVISSSNDKRTPHRET